VFGALGVSVLAPFNPTGFLQDLSSPIAQSIKVRDFDDAIAGTTLVRAPKKRTAGIFRSRLCWRTTDYLLPANVTAEAPASGEASVSAVFAAWA
jgi:hypothetical protein